MSNIHPLALFRLTVLGPLISRDTLKHGELKRLLRELASKRYDIPYSKHCYLSEKTIKQWFYTWKRGGIDALAPKTRRDCGHSKLPMELQDALLEAKRENPKRSLDQLKALMEQSGLANWAVTLSPSSFTPQTSAVTPQWCCQRTGGTSCL